MNQRQPWYLSRGIWGALVSVVATLAAVLSHNKVQILPADQDQIVTLILTIAGAVGSGVALYGRIAATKQISSAPSNPNLQGPQP
jgi:hypothetical protein